MFWNQGGGGSHATAATIPDARPGLAYPAASVIALAALCLPDAVVPRSPEDLRTLAILFGLVLGLGTLHGLLFELALRIVGSWPAALSFAFWPALTLGGAAQLARSLGAFARIGGRYHRLALIVFAASALGALAIGALLLAVQPRAGAPQGWLARLRPRRRALAVSVLLASAVALTIADRRLYASQYLAGHLALRCAALWLAMCALYAGPVWLRLPRLTKGRALAAAAAFTTAALLHGDAYSARSLAVPPWPATLLQVGRTLLDFDRDGYPALLGGGDCAELDPRIHPGAREVPDNGIDDNCLSGDAKRRPERPEHVTMPERPSPVDVVLVTVDSLRPDHLNLGRDRHRFGRDTSPYLTRWARDAVVFRNAYSPGAWTSVALSSVMRGVYARRIAFALFYETNQVRLLRSPDHTRLAPGEQLAKAFPLPADDAHPTLASWLGRRGMFTQAVVDDGYAQVLEPNTGVGRGFEAYHKVDALPPPRRDDRGAVDLALERLRAMPAGRRFFLWLHLFGPHSPSERHDGVPEYGPRELDRYDHEIRFLDQQLARFLDAVAARTQPTVVIVTSDHGEVFDGDFRMHGFAMSVEDVHVPLLIRAPGWRPAVVEQLVTTLDVMPTVLAITGTPIPAGLDGVDLARWGEQRLPQEHRLLISDTWQYAPDTSCFNDRIAAYDGRNMLVLDRSSHTFLAYDMTRERWQPLSPPDAATSPLGRALAGYVDETGGRLDLSD